MEIDGIVFTDGVYKDKNCYISDLGVDLPPRIMNRLKEINFTSEIDFYQKLEILLEEYRSYYLFPTDLVSFYSTVEELKAKYDTICHISGAIIKKGEKYYRFKPIIDNLSTGKTYTITTNIRASLGYQDFFPKTLLEFELWAQKLEASQFFDDDTINFYSLMCNCGSNALHLKEFKKDGIRRKKRLNNKQLKELYKREMELLNIINKNTNQQFVQKELQKTREKIKKLENKHY